MGAFDVAVIVINMVGAAAASVVNARAVVRSPYLRPVRAAIAAYAGIFVVSYCWLLITRDVTPWSRVMRGVSIPSWWLVWAGPAFLAGRTQAQIVGKIEALAHDDGGVGAG